MRQAWIILGKVVKSDLLKRVRIPASTTANVRSMSTVKFPDALTGPFNFVDNARCEPIELNETFPNLEPRSGKKISDVAVSGSAEVDRAVKAAKQAGAEWSKVSTSKVKDSLRCC